MPQKDSHCSYCGHAFPPEPDFPRECKNCRQTTYLNPVPVAVVLLPVGAGLLFIRRNIEPRQGTLNLPGGFINKGESWQEAASRELWEETGIRIAAEDVTLFDVHSAPDGTVLIFGLSRPYDGRGDELFFPNAETSEMVVMAGPVELGFPLHTRVVKAYWEQRSAGP